MSAASDPLPQSMTVGEFLAYDDGTLIRYELVDGVMVAMSLPHPRHADIVQNMGRAIEPQLVPPCSIYWAAIGVAAGEQRRNWREPDLVVACVRPEEGYIRSPRLVVEVLSPSTEKEDRTVKLDFYETLPSLTAVLLVWQDELGSSAFRWRSRVGRSRRDRLRGRSRPQTWGSPYRRTRSTPIPEARRCRGRCDLPRP